jgi:endonuclease/exonuclease/phosphatase (EEP) superfamily protein YafD
VLGCRCLKVTLAIHGQEVTVINAHIWSPRISVERGSLIPRIIHFDNRRQLLSFSALLLQNAATSGPLIVLGDLNTTERQPNYQRLNQVLHNAHARAGWGMGYTFPTNVSFRAIPVPPFVRIDHIFYNDAWRAVAAPSGRLSESDHAYVLADLVLIESFLNTDSTDFAD